MVVFFWDASIQSTEQAKQLQRITKGSPEVTEVWTDNHRSEEEMFVEVELAVARVNDAEGAARSTVLKVAQKQPNNRFATWQVLADGYHNCVAQEMQRRQRKGGYYHVSVVEGGRIRTSIRGY